MLDITQECLSTIERPYDLVLQYGSTANTPQFDNLKVSKDFLNRDEAMHYFKEADLIFSHCGIGSIYNSLQFNRPTVLIPRLEKFEEFSDDHQLQIANEVKRNELINVIEGKNDNYKNEFVAFLSFAVRVKKCSRDIINYELGKTINEFF